MKLSDMALHQLVSLLTQLRDEHKKTPCLELRNRRRDVANEIDERLAIA